MTDQDEFLPANKGRDFEFSQDELDSSLVEGSTIDGTPTDSAEAANAIPVVPADPNRQLNSGPTSVASLKFPGFWSLDRNFIRVEQIVGYIICAVLAVGGLIGIAVWGVLGIGFWWVMGIVVAALLLAFLFFMSWWWPRLEFKYTAWRLTESELEVRKGVLWRHQISVPLARLQHADVAQGPLQRAFGLGKLVVHTAGTQNASVEINGLAHHTAIDLRNQLVSQKEAFDVV